MEKVLSKKVFFTLVAIIAVLLAAIVGQQVKTSQLEQAGEYVVIHPNFENQSALALWGGTAYHLQDTCKVTAFSQEEGSVIKEYPAPSYLPMESAVFTPLADMAKDLGLDC